VEPSNFVESEPRTASSPGRRVRDVVLYVMLWLAAAGAGVALLAVVLDSGEGDTVALPPVRETNLVSAARKADCELRRTAANAPSNPPATGTPGPLPVSPGFKETSPDAASLIAALRRGIVVIHFRRGLDDERVSELRTMQQAVPDGTVVTPNATRMPYEVAATAHRRLLGCERFTDDTLDALRLFRGRFLGSGPDR